MEHIPVANVTTDEKDAQAVYDVVKSGWISKGKKVEAFEGAFAEYTHARAAIAVSSGTAALHTILAGLEVGPGDEVIVPSLTFVSTANAVLYQGATPVLVECRSDTFNTTPEIIEAAITERTKAIIPVDMNGMPVDFDAMAGIGEKYKIPVIFDSAESLGAVYKNKPVGGNGSLHMFSFFPNKSVTTGEGGMITVSDPDLEKKMRMIMNQGQDGRYNHVMLGYNYRMNDILAALGSVQLDRIEQIMAEKEYIAGYYDEAFKSIDEIEIPYLPSYVNRHSWYMYAIKVDEKIRDAVVQYLKKENIDTRLSFPPIHTQKYYQDRFGYDDTSLPVSFLTWKRLINLPVWPGLREEQLAYIASKVIEGIRKYS